MNLLAELTDKFLSLGEGEQRKKDKYTVRRAARAVVLNEEGLVALQHIEREQYAKLPGGGMDPGETIDEALARELREEVGIVEYELLGEIGMIMEYRNQMDLLQISYAFVVRVKGELAAPSLDPEEVEEGLHHTWVTPEEAMQVLATQTHGGYKEHFILERDKILFASWFHSYVA